MRSTFFFATVSIALAATACTGDDGHEHCTEGEYICSGDILQVCVDDAFVDEEDCAAEGLTCHAEMGHCMADDTDMQM